MPKASDSSTQVGKSDSSNTLPGVPSISLPKCGDAIRGMGEKFAAHPVTGTGSMSVPIASSPGRSGFGPQLSLSYDSGTGNGHFGFGWGQLRPSITRKADKGLPQCFDAEESDVFILSGAEDLAPVLAQDAHGKWGRENPPPHLINEVTYRIKHCRPHCERFFPALLSLRFAANAFGTLRLAHSQYGGGHSGRGTT